MHTWRLEDLTRVLAKELDDGAVHLLHGPHSLGDDRVEAAGPHAPRDLPVPDAQLAHGVVVGRGRVPAVLQRVGWNSNLN